MKNILHIIGLFCFIHFAILRILLIKLEKDIFSNHILGSGGGDSGLVILPVIVCLLFAITSVTILYIINHFLKNKSYIIYITIYCISYFNFFYIFYWDTKYISQIYSSNECYDVVGKIIIFCYFIFSLLLTYFSLKKYLFWK